MPLSSTRIIRYNVIIQKIVEHSI